ncbi:MAG: hypothetical protein V3W34_01630 [Phycisphaerae bacterium]
MSTVFAAMSLVVFIGFLDLWARSLWSVDYLITPLGRFGCLEAASGNGRMVVGVNRSDRPLHTRFKVASHDRRSGDRPAALIMSSRVIRSVYFDQSMVGFLWATDKRSLLASVPYWFLLAISGVLAFVMTRIWWHRRIGRLW